MVKLPPNPENSPKSTYDAYVKLIEIIKNLGYGTVDKPYNSSSLKMPIYTGLEPPKVNSYNWKTVMDDRTLNVMPTSVYEPQIKKECSTAKANEISMLSNPIISERILTILSGMSHLINKTCTEISIKDKLSHIDILAGTSGYYKKFTVSTADLFELSAYMKGLVFAHEYGIGLEKYAKSPILPTCYKSSIINVFDILKKVQEQLHQMNYSKYSAITISTETYAVGITIYYDSLKVGYHVSFESLKNAEVVDYCIRYAVRGLISELCKAITNPSSAIEEYKNDYSYTPIVENKYTYGYDNNDIPNYKISPE